MFIDPDDPVVSYNAACTYCHLGEHDKAFATLEKWATNNGTEMELWMENNSDFNAIRDDPRFDIFMAKVRQARAAS